MIKTVKESKNQLFKASVEDITARFNYTRRNYYKARLNHDQEVSSQGKALELVQRERAQQSKLSGKKLHSMLSQELVEKGIKMGRDKLYDLLRGHDLLIKRPKGWTKTTDSNHRFGRYPNLLKNIELNRPNQVYVSDITYIRTLGGFMYLCLIMDAYSRKIVGWCLHDTLEVEGCLNALDMALSALSKNERKHLIHHSDHGVQYCCDAYRKKLKDNGVSISMAAVGDCYENAQAERLNGILKQEYGLGHTIKNKSIARQLGKQAIELYNTQRPHLALKMHTPSQVHSGAAKPVVRMGWPKKTFKPKVAQAPVPASGSSQLSKDTAGG